MNMLKKIALVVLFTSAACQATMLNILDFPQPDNVPDEFYAVTEIPAGGMIKYETDSKTGFIVADRFQAMPVAYPANYGSLTQSLGGDGDPLDVIFYTRAPMAPGTLIKLRPIGVLKMIDGGEVDDKIVAVPASKIDSTYDDIHQVSDLPGIEQQRLEAFFRVYKQLPDGRKKVELNGYKPADAARAEIKQAFEAYKTKIATAGANGQ
ncbi:pyrophosphatase [Erwinia sp. OLTSP20]|uniref:inorganic diphosphatase n=1 Tax=unclassified Erwinia TaxID=2622719 RepID=UPI000C1771C0|nr:MULTISPECIES: inorganic diphosphatase [unclassified Erwinia]PIJ50478.1 pyrophosphatase [Erwinia sp. OAMSP11]PIJ72572.1 pyrophosphatase [Erwinia sp. OLSSP12]PIJ82052.1 pyrophosphatase [Erwinia sp. OLCASP19]PIJ84935.1 pyrophosphatase [Erwinia sp. OLMTSP26]PIJ86539.1 pyrophosphatase [Erwinia sp. OLMDSP33]